MHRRHRLSARAPARKGHRAPARNLPLDRRAPDRHRPRARHRHGQELLLACAIAFHQACRKGFRVLYRRVPRLFDELRLQPAPTAPTTACSPASPRPTCSSSTTSPSRPSPRTPAASLLEILEDRYGLRSTVFTSQLKPDRWHAFLADPTVADAICDRVLHGAHKLALAGPSRRKTPEESTKD